MRVVEAACGGVVTVVVLVIVVRRLHLDVDLVSACAVGFLVAFGVVLLRPGDSARYRGRR